LVVPVGGTMPQVQFTATLGGKTVTATWSVDRSDVATIDANGLLTPTGTTGGTLQVTASSGSMSAQLPYDLSLLLVQVGDPAATINGGIGGDGRAGTVSAGQQAAFGTAPSSDPAVKLLYPYDHTVWPQQLTAPLLQWTSGSHTFDAVYVDAKERYFEYQGFLGKNVSSFKNVPFPQNAWEQLTSHNVGEPVTVTITFLQGANVIGPVQVTWTVASAPLPGRIYYGAYNSMYAINYSGAVAGNRFGSAVLMASPSPSASPVPVAGFSSATDSTGCRQCHALSANGKVLTAQWGSNYTQAYSYDLTNNHQETMLGSPSALGFAALTFDGTGAVSSMQNDGGGDSANNVYTISPFAKLTASGQVAAVRGSFPSFSLDSKHVVLTDLATKALAIYDFAQSTATFSNYHVILTSSPAPTPAVWPAYVPTNDAVVFELETRTNAQGGVGETRADCPTPPPSGCASTGTHGELWWIDLGTMTPTRLDVANGLSYLPTNADHPDDTQVNYQPTVAPVAAGGYLWVAFTSRRIYGNVATINPWWSDPRQVDLTTMTTPKKIWIAAIDPGAKPGTDPSHPAFYLPVQELAAANGRPLWGLAP
jgi:hypothetical protein